MYSSKLLNLAEKIYTTINKEALAMIYAIQKFRQITY
jgi:hypothetical protein